MDTDTDVHVWKQWQSAVESRSPYMEGWWGTRIDTSVSLEGLAVNSELGTLLAAAFPPQNNTTALLSTSTQLLCTGGFDVWVTLTETFQPSLLTLPMTYQKKQQQIIQTGRLSCCFSAVPELSIYMSLWVLIHPVQEVPPPVPLPSIHPLSVAPNFQTLLLFSIHAVFLLYIYFYSSQVAYSDNFLASRTQGYVIELEFWHWGLVFIFVPEERWRACLGKVLSPTIGARRAFTYRWQMTQIKCYASPFGSLASHEETKMQRCGEMLALNPSINQ